MTDKQFVISVSCNFTPKCLIVPVNGYQNRFEYQNKEKESTFGLNRINLGARTYNPTTGRMDGVG
jgi:hypothetical protein